MGEVARKLALETDPGPSSEDDLEHGDEWAEEIDRRIEDLRSGRAKAIPLEEADAEIKAKYGWD